MRWIALIGVAWSVTALAQAADPAPGAPAPSATPPGDGQPFDVEKLFANTCGWCHSNAGRTAGRGPRLMGTTLTDAEIIHRVKKGKTGAMPAFGSQFNDDQLRAIVQYIRSLKDDGTAK
ncbi:MAG TPA: cytochrome c [Casimicrobiaceae bacterium]|jgi:mono/diheme cytochrome c family protein